MNRTEALNILGLDEDATTKDIKVAYKECVQILHPDRFANNKMLADRATEQFKRLQDAYEFLTSGKGQQGEFYRFSFARPLQRRHLDVKRGQACRAYRRANPIGGAARLPHRRAP